MIDWKSMRRITKDYLQQFNIDVNPSTPVKSLGVANQQLIEIMKALLRETENFATRRADCIFIWR